MKTGSAKEITYDLSKLLPAGVTGTTDYAVDTVKNENGVLSSAPTEADILSGATCGNRAYNGTAYAYTGTPVWKTEENVTVTGDTTVAYYEVQNITEDVIVEVQLQAAPTDAGSYRAEFTITSDAYEGTARYSFEITKAPVTVAAKNKSISGQ